MKTLKESLLDDFGSQTKDLRKERIKDWLEKNHISESGNHWPLKYKINNDLTIDIDNFIYNGEGNFPDYIRFNKCKYDFTIRKCKMTSLRGCPQYVGGTFRCSYNLLKTLDGGPEKVGHNYVCSNNSLTALKGVSKIVVLNFDCSYNNLADMKGCPKASGISCSNNKLVSLEGCPEQLAWDFDCENNKLTTLEGCPQRVEGDFYCRNNHLTTLEGGPKKVGGTIFCTDDQIS